MSPPAYSLRSGAHPSRCARLTNERQCSAIWIETTHAKLRHTLRMTTSLKRTACPHQHTYRNLALVQADALAQRTFVLRCGVGIHCSQGQKGHTTQPVRTRSTTYPLKHFNRTNLEQRERDSVGQGQKGCAQPVRARHKTYLLRTRSKTYSLKLLNLE
jgi:hypothetical protein